MVDLGSGWNNLTLSSERGSSGTSLLLTVLWTVACGKTTLRMIESCSLIMKAMMWVCNFTAVLTTLRDWRLNDLVWSCFAFTRTDDKSPGRSDGSYFQDIRLHTSRRMGTRYNEYQERISYHLRESYQKPRSLNHRSENRQIRFE